MELLIKNPAEHAALPRIEFNHEDLKSNLRESLQKYQGLVFTEDTLPDAKVTLANLRKLKTAIDDKRKEVKKRYAEPVTEFEKKIKELTTLIDEPIALIDKQVKDFDEQRRQEKIARCKEYFLGSADEHRLTDLISWSQIEKPNFGNASESMKSIEKDIDDQLESIAADMRSIEALNSEFEFELLDYYRRSLNLPQTLSELQRLKSLAEAKERAEEQRKVEQPIENAQDFPVLTKVKSDNPQYTVNFIVTGTQEQLVDLANFMRSHNIQFRNAKA